MARERGDSDRTFYLPDFCASRAALAIVLIVELTALVLTLAHGDASVGFWTDFERTSLFILWVGLSGAILLCWLGSRLKKLPAEQGSAAVLALISTLIALASVATFYFGRSNLVADAGATIIFPRLLSPFLLRNIAIGFIVSGVALRYFYVTHEWRRNIEKQAAARVHALQARIRPHFLFNSMNTIASLTRSNPAMAEQAVQDLADLFRANLSDKRNTITLAEECEVARIYQRIEQLRLGERLKVDWKIDSLPRLALVPGLLLQPLLENAIYHGIEPQPAGGTVTVTGELAGGSITVIVRNPVIEGGSQREGNRVALDNVRERLALMYGGRALVKAGRFDNEYIVTLRFPHIENRSRLST